MLIKKSYLVSRINRLLFKGNNLRYFSQDNNWKLFETIVFESYNEICKNWGSDVTFVIIRASKSNMQIEDTVFDELKNKHIKVFDLYKYININDKKYKDATRPNALYWHDVVKIIIKGLNTLITDVKN